MFAYAVGAWTPGEYISYPCRLGMLYTIFRAATASRLALLAQYDHDYDASKAEWPWGKTGDFMKDYYTTYWDKFPDILWRSKSLWISQAYPSRWILNYGKFRGGRRSGWNGGRLRGPRNSLHRRCRLRSQETSDRFRDWDDISGILESTYGYICH